jgi:putative transposase
LGQKKEIVCRYIAQGMKRDVGLRISGISKHQYYYKPKAGTRGRRPTSYTDKIDEKDAIKTVPNSEVIEEIKRIQQDPDLDGGYHKMRYELVHVGYLINHKKVYRLMTEAALLKDKYKAKDKEYVRYRVVTPEQPLQVLEMDIKMIWVVQDRRNVFVLTIIDTFTRVVLHWRMGYRMTSAQVKAAWEHVIIEHLQPADILSQEVHIELRNDNGPQFSAAAIRSFLADNHIGQVFTHPYTPQENGHVESFHFILKKAIENQTFWSYNQLEERLILFYEKYNNRRIHSALAYLCPQIFWELWDENKIQRIELPKKKVKFKLLIPRHQISGHMSLREVPCSKSNPLDGGEVLQKKKCTSSKHSNLKWTTSV